MVRFSPVVKLVIALCVESVTAKVKVIFVGGLASSSINSGLDVKEVIVGTFVFL